MPSAREDPPGVQPRNENFFHEIADLTAEVKTLELADEPSVERPLP